MLRITEKQREALGHKARESYLKKLEKRFAERSPDLAQTLDDERRETAVTRAVDAAESHGFTNRGPIRMYFDLCLAFGSGFVTDPCYPWAAKAIGDPDPETQMDRAEDLYAKSLETIEEIYGPDNEFGKAAIRRLNYWARTEHEFADLKADDAVREMRILHPEKAAHAKKEARRGDDALRQLFGDAEVACKKLDAIEPRAVMLITALKFGFGAGCLDDPLYPWIGITLSQENVPVSADRFNRLERKALRWMDAILSKQETT